MRKTAIGTGLWLVAIAAALPAAASTMWEVEVGDYYYSPAALPIQVGDTVRWTNVAGQEHEVACDVHVAGVGAPTCPEDFHGHLMGSGGTFSFRFDTAGVYVIHCNLGGLHNTMKQVIVVTP